VEGWRKARVFFSKLKDHSAQKIIYPSYSKKRILPTKTLILTNLVFTKSNAMTDPNSISDKLAAPSIHGS